MAEQVRVCMTAVEAVGLVGRSCGWWMVVRPRLTD